MQGHVLHLRTDLFISHKNTVKFLTVGKTRSLPHFINKKKSQEKFLDFPLGSAPLEAAVALTILLHNVKFS